MNISLLVGLRNNLDYSKHFYSTTRALYPNEQIVFVSYGSTDGTHEWLDSLSEDKNTIIFHSTESKTFSETFNKAAELATNDYVVYLHNDIVLAPNFIENIEKYCKEDVIVSYTTIEPPIFAGHERPGKIISDFGTDLDTFDNQKMTEFVEVKKEEFKDKTEDGITFFMCSPRQKLLEIGGLDCTFKPYYCEDDDLIMRWKTLGLKCITSLDAICYHFVSKTSRFSEENKNQTHLIELISNRNFIRKWKSRHPIARYDIGYIIHNCNLQILELLEIWCDDVYVDMDTTSYYETEQFKTGFDLKYKLRDIKDIPTNDVIVEFDASKLTQDNYNILQKLQDIIASAEGAVGKFELDIFSIQILNGKDLKKEFIYNDSSYYKMLLLKD